MYLPYAKIEKLLSEYQLWCKKLEGCSKKCTAIETFEKYSKQFFLLIRKLFQILITLPGSTLIAEHLYSNLKCIQTNLRKVIRQECLNGLNLLNIYRDITIEPLGITTKTKLTHINYSYY